jgi:GH15 family glucan-1,4-alpha-glucosidase
VPPAGAARTSGLFTEEYNVAQRQLRANIPQAFVHAAMLETAVRLMPSVPDGDALDRLPGWG